MVETYKVEQTNKQRENKKIKMKCKKIPHKCKRSSECHTLRFRIYIYIYIYRVINIKIVFSCDIEQFVKIRLIKVITAQQKTSFRDRQKKKIFEFKNEKEEERRSKR